MSYLNQRPAQVNTTAKQPGPKKSNQQQWIDNTYQNLQQFGQGVKNLGSGIYGGADIALGGALPGGPVQNLGEMGTFNIPLKAYIDKRMIKGDVLRNLKSDVEHYIRNGLEPEAAVRLVIGNKKKQFISTLTPGSAQNKAIQDGDRDSALGKAVHNAANTFKYFESASPKEYEEMFSDFGINDGSFVKNQFLMPDRPNSAMGMVEGGVDMIRSGASGINPAPTQTPAPNPLLPRQAKGWGVFE